MYHLKDCQCIMDIETVLPQITWDCKTNCNQTDLAYETYSTSIQWYLEKIKQEHQPLVQNQIIRLLMIMCMLIWGLVTLSEGAGTTFGSNSQALYTEFPGLILNCLTSDRIPHTNRKWKFCTYNDNHELQTDVKVDICRNGRHVLSMQEHCFLWLAKTVSKVLKLLFSHLADTTVVE